MSDPTRTRGTLTLNKPCSPQAVTGALIDAWTPIAAPFDRLPPAQLSVAALLAGGSAPSFGSFFGLAEPADTAMSANPSLKENSDVARSE